MGQGDRATERLDPLAELHDLGRDPGHLGNDHDSRTAPRSVHVTGLAVEREGRPGKAGKRFVAHGLGTLTSCAVAGPRPFRFGVQCSSPPGDGRNSWAEVARACEDLGYSTLTVADHFDGQLAPIPALMAAADATTTLRVGALVMCTDFTHPVVLA